MKLFSIFLLPAVLGKHLNDVWEILNHAEDYDPGLKRFKMLYLFLSRREKPLQSSKRVRNSSWLLLNSYILIELE